jgi:hypothetical protein
MGIGLGAQGIFDQIKEALGDVTYDQAVIERQPGRSLVMLRIQSLLEAYFVLQGIPTTLYDSRHKLGFASTTPYWESKMDGTKNLSYFHRKKLAVRVTSGFIAAQSRPMQLVWYQAKKKDDLADCFLQACAFGHRYQLPEKPRCEEKERKRLEKLRKKREKKLQQEKDREARKEARKKKR